MKFASTCVKSIKTPAFEKANKGIIKNADNPCKLCSNLTSGF